MAAEDVANVFKTHSDHKAQLDGLVVLLKAVFPTPDQLDSERLLELVKAVVGLEAGSMVVSRHFVQLVTDRLGQAQLPLDAVIAVYRHLLDALNSRAISYEDQCVTIRFRLAELFEKKGYFAEAAVTLSGLPLESSQKPMPADQKMMLYLRISQLLLDNKQYDDAEVYINRAVHHQTEVSTDLATKFKTIMARVLDCKRKFIEAAQKYYEVSLLPDVSKEQKEEAIVRSMTCTVLASPGSQRTQMLATLYKDERTHNLSIFGLLQKLFLDRLIKSPELIEFEDSLDCHQRADDTGHSIIRGVILEHNMTAVSLFYTTISFETLGNLLGIDGEKAEEVVVQMISTNRLSGTIDQIEGVVTFKGLSQLRQLDDQILTMCQQVNTVSNMILAAHPELAAQ